MITIGYYKHHSDSILNRKLLLKATSLLLDLIFVIIWLIPSIVFSQTPTLKEFNLSDGLPSSHIYQTIQDRNGFIWIATDKGVSKYNGYSFENFTVKEGLPTNDVWGLHEDKKGRIWLSTFNKLVYIKNGKIFTLDPENVSLSGKSVNHVINDNIHLVKIFTPSRLLYQIDDNLKLSPPFKSNEWNQVLSLLFLFDLNNNISLDNHSKEKDLVLASQWRLLDKDQVLRKFVQSKVAKSTRTILINEAQILFNFQDSLLRYKNGKLQKLKINLEHIRNQKAVCIVNSHHYLLPSQDYTYWLDENFQVIPDLLLEPNLNINTASLDRENNLWISTNDGLFLLRRKALGSKSYNSINNAPLELFSIQQDDLNRIWMGGNNSTFYLFNRNGNHKTFKISDNFNKSINGIHFAPKGGMILSGYYNYHIPKKSYDNILRSNSYKKDFSLLKWQKNNNNQSLLINTKCVLSKDKSIFISHSNSLTEIYISNNIAQPLSTMSINRTYALAIDSKNNMSFGQVDGVYFQNASNKSQSKPNLPSLRVPITNLKYDNQDYLWIATQGQGLFRSRENHVDTIQELLGQYVDNIKIYNNKEIWVSNSIGIHHVNIESNEPLGTVTK